MIKTCENCINWIEHWKFKGLGFCIEHQMSMTCNRTCGQFSIHKLAKEGINEKR